MATVTITSHVIKFANRIIQISNISEASLWVDKTAKIKASRWFWTGSVVVAGCLLAASIADEETRPVIGFGVMLGIVLVVISTFFKPLYHLHLYTSSGQIIPMGSRKHALMQQVLSEIQDAMAHRDPNKNVTINVGNAIIDSQVVNSQVGSHIGGNVTNNTRREEQDDDKD